MSTQLPLSHALPFSRPSAVDCIAVRLWFDRRVPTRFPANVLAGFEQDTGATFFDLNYLQVDLAGVSSIQPADRACIPHAWSQTECLGSICKSRKQTASYYSFCLGHM